MNAKDYGEFFDSLPSRLEHMLHKYTVKDKVLQGYRGPGYLCNGKSGDSGHLYASDGIQEVRYWYGCPKKYLLIPIGGLLGFPIIRAFEDTDWYSMFFDASTGEALSKNRAEAERLMREKREEQ